MIVFSASDFAGSCDVHSTTGYAVFVYGCDVYQRSTKQKCVTTSTFEAELVAGSTSAKHTLYFMRLMKDFGVKIDKAPLYVDNEACIKVSRGGGSHVRSRHIRVCDAWLYQCVHIDNKINIIKIRSEANVADINTKVVTKESFLFLRSLLMGYGIHRLPRHLREVFAILYD